MTWKDAVGLALEGREEGYNFLYQQTYQKSYYVALKYMKQEEEAADVLQDAYIKAFQNLDQLQEPDKFPGWFSRIVASKALDELRKKKAVLFSQMQTEDSEEVSMEELLVDERVENRPELAMDREETSRLVQEMIAGLSDEQRMCVMMFYIEQMSVKNIAEVTGVSENTVKSRLKYGRKNIEEKVLELERKGTKLYGITPFPFFLYFLLRDTYSAGVFQIPLRNILQTAGIATFHGTGVGNGASVGSGAGAGSGTGVGSGAGMGTAASAAAKTSSVAAGKIIAGVIAGIVVTAGVTTAVVSLASRQPEKPEAADTIEERKEEPVVEVETETETETETEVDEDKIWQDAYLAFAESQNSVDNGYAVIDVANYDIPLLIEQPDVFTAESNSITYSTDGASCTNEYLYEVKIYYYDRTTETVQPVDNAINENSSNGALISGYMEFGYYLSYIPERQLLLGDIMGSGDTALESYSFDASRASLVAEDTYLGTDINNTGRKNIVYYRTVEKALENRDAVKDKTAEYY